MPEMFSQLLSHAFDIGDVPQPVFEFIRDLIGNRRLVGVIYYGSSFWKKDLTGLLDFYVVCETLSEWYGDSIIQELANGCLPPNVEYHEWQNDTVSLRVKVAILSLHQLRNATALCSIDTTMWARFCQPVRIIWWRGQAEKEALFRCLVRAAGTALWWAAYLGPDQGQAEDYWCTLFRHTYHAELRVETKSRPALLLENRVPYFTQLLTSGWRLLGIPYVQLENGQLVPQITERQRQSVRKRWRIRERLGRPLNILRLIKAAFTFRGGAQYIVWKINRHRGLGLQLTDFQKKHPLLTAPWILVRLYRQGVFTR